MRVMEAAPRPSVWARVCVVAGGLVFLVSLLYFAYSYLHRFGQAADPSAPVAPAVAIDLALFALFAAHHSVFARAGVKGWVNRLVSPAYERSVYVWTSSLLFLVVCALWQPVPGSLWVAPPGVPPLLSAAQVVGVILTVRSAGRIDIMELAGLRQATAPQTPASPPELVRSGPYAFVRHPVYLGWLLLVWPVAEMTGTRLVLAAASTVYLALAVRLEERDLGRVFGAEYAAYQRDVRWRMVPWVY